MFLLVHDTEDSDQHGANRDQRRPNHRRRSKRIAQNHTSEESVKDEGDCAKGGENDDGKSIELKDGGEDVGGDVDSETDEPERTTDGSTALVERFELVLYVGFALDREAL